MIDRRSLELLEFPAIRARLADFAAFAPSRRLAEAVTPSTDPIVVRRLLDETDEAREFMVQRPDAGVGGARDIEPVIGRARRGGRLDGEELLAVLDTLIAAGRLADALRGERRPLLHELGRGLKPLPQLRGRLEASVGPSGELLDSASPALGGLRRAVRVAYERLRARLEQLVHGSELSGTLQEPIITLRNGRYVVPVRAEAKGRVKGIVHDQSGSGQTLFIEPLVALELGNAWREAQLAAQAEEERILDELSALVEAQAAALAETLEALARFDLWLARARLSAELDGIRPAEAAGWEVELLSARHPGLTGRVVPIDLRLGTDFRALVITGPNTGGKTVALRTLGLLALMHQSGLHVPVAEGSRLPVFRDVLADIGDEQSIAQSLSTFSGHMRAIVRIVEGAGEGSLVLLDELGAGTDPTEGSALAQALLDHFIRAGALVAATTHYAELKTYAHNTEAARNASVEFDLETLSPTYRLRIGLPGTSQAFAIAERLGLPAELVADARSRLSRAQQEFEATLVSIRDAQQTTEEALERARVAEMRAASARAEAEEERSRARRERDAAVAEARAQAERALAEVRAEIHAAREMLGRSALTQQRLDETVAHLEERLAAVLPAAGQPAAEGAPSVPAAPAALAPGSRVRSREGWQGRLLSIDERQGQATLEAGALRVTVPLGDLEPVTGGVPGAGRRGEFGPGGAPAVLGSGGGGRGAARAVSSGSRAVPSSLDLRGARVEEALEMLERYVDQASLAGAERVTVVHGHGSGALRDSLRERLSTHELVRSWRPGERGEGGDGATIIEF
ncbi:MAG TPA: endonuclease MutS2 [Candidatus Limnocylindria bacterium]|nr:endonuclease MutS2 [Candidatus Limnocylindria bacterium]